MKSGTIVFLAIAGCCCLTACNQSEKSSGASVALEMVEKTDPYGNIERISRRVTDFARQGLYTKVNPAGEIIEIAQYENDSLHGFRVLFSETGDTQIVETYRHGLFDGPYRAFYPNEQIEIQGQYTNNVMTGKWRRYYETGAVMEIVTFENNEENGPFVEYHPNGSLKAQGTYLNGDTEHGELKLYNEEGKLVKTMNCQYGVCRTTWTAEGGPDT